MGMYDTIMVPCPECKALYGAQTKSGACFMETYQLEDAVKGTDMEAQAALLDVNRHAPFVCGTCGTAFKIDLRIAISAIPVVVPVKSGQEA